MVTEVCELAREILENNDYEIVRNGEKVVIQDKLDPDGYKLEGLAVHEDLLVLEAVNFLELG